MPRKRKSSSPFSLFSFQDIITAVCGIIILVTLLLALRLTISIPASPSPDSVSERLFRDLEQQRQHLMNHIESLQSEIRSLNDIDAGFFVMRDHVIQEKTNELHLKNEDVQKSVAELTVLLESLKEIFEQKQKEHEALSGMKEQNKRFREEIVSLQTRIEYLKEDSPLLFSLSSWDGRTPWMIDITARSIKVIGIKDTHEQTFTNIRLFLAWVEKNKDAYFYLLVRPSGVDQYHKIFDSFLKDELTFGTDVIGENTEIKIGRADES